MHLLVLVRCFNLYFLKCVITKLIFDQFCLVPPLQLGALSVRLVRLWVNPALIMKIFTHIN